VEEDEERQRPPVWLGDLAREDPDPLAVEPRAAERDGELVLGEDGAGRVVGGGDAWILAPRTPE
jgi:hypothetical protein